MDADIDGTVGGVIAVGGVIVVCTYLVHPNRGAGPEQLVSTRRRRELGCVI